MMDKKKAAKEALVKEMALNSNRILDIEGLLWIKESGGKWKEAFSFIRTSGVYFSVKGKSKVRFYFHFLNFPYCETF